MKKLIIFIIYVLFMVFPANVRADVDGVSRSAQLNTEYNETENNIDFRINTLEKYLKSHNSPLAEHADEFVKWADYYDLDWRLVVAISGVESTFGKRIPYNSHNAYGWAGGKYVFETWPDSIEHVSEALRENYIDKNAETISKIAKRYCPPNNTWGWKVKYFMEKIEPVPVTYDF